MVGGVEGGGLNRLLNNTLFMTLQTRVTTTKALSVLIVSNCVLMSSTVMVMTPVHSRQHRPPSRSSKLPSGFPNVSVEVHYCIFYMYNLFA